MKSGLAWFGCAWIFLAATALCSTPITVRDQKGRAIDIELISVADGSVTFSRSGSPQEFTLPLSNFEESSQTLISKQAKLLPPALPKIRPEVIIGKRRRDKEGSDYMEIQQISATIKLTNMENNTAVPEIDGTYIVLGQDRKTPAVLSVLHKQQFTASIRPAGTVSRVMDTVATTYDSDNKGQNNLGGFEYYGYILVMKMKDGTVILNQASPGSIQLAVTDKRHMLDKILNFKKEEKITNKLEPVTKDTKLRIPK